VNRSQIEKLVEDQDGMRLFQQERLILDVTERICEIMEEKGISRKQLAEELGTSKSFITQLLDGGRNMTLRTLSDVLLALGSVARIQTGPVGASVKSPAEFSADLGKARWPIVKKASKVKRPASLRV